MTNKFICKDCGKCCQWSGGLLAPKDKEKIAQSLNITTKELQEKYLEEVELFGTKGFRPKSPKPYGPCIFYDKEKHCTIHEVKPELCKLANCKEDATKKFIKKHFVDQNNKASLDEWNLSEEINQTNK
ncbi:YkgJ family cysteine cluster protein [Candidatus Woesearchaeota archaeon]|nr:YkgJ family cysteine cluster protein [Candidatus Woesearchaeota archaeon]